MDFIFEQVSGGEGRNLAYLLGDRSAGVAAIIDPAYSPELLVSRAKAQRLRVLYVVNTHGHNDQIHGNQVAKRLTGAKIAAYHGSMVRPEVPLHDDEALSLGDLTLRIIHVPGHSPDSIVIYVPEYGIALTGDHLLVGRVGATATDAESTEQYKGLRRIERQLPAETTIWPGHDVGPRPASTLALEKATNPFLLVDDFALFLELKHEWVKYKDEMGLV